MSRADLVSRAKHRNGEVDPVGLLSLGQLRTFWTVARGPSLTRAAKQLGSSQPALSQQLAKLEAAIGGRLFDRINNQLHLTDAGRYLLRRAETILAEVDETEAGLQAFVEGRRGRIAIGVLGSLARAFVPEALRLARTTMPELELDLHELAPAEAIEQLYGRNLHMAILSARSVAENRLSFARVPLFEEAYALAVPKGLDLAAVGDPAVDLDADRRALLERCIQFNFGNQHNQRVEEWYRRVLPRHRVIATCRSYEAALAMVEAGLGVALVPALAAWHRQRPLFEVDLWAAPGFSRPIIALVPPQYVRLRPFGPFLDALQQASLALSMPVLGASPPFLHRADEVVAPPAAEAITPGL